MARPDRYGAHYIHENRPCPLSLRSDRTNPHQPQEVAYYIPSIPQGADANGVNDVHVDINGIMYVVNRLRSGLYTLEMSI